jgi:hypothetical protein
MKQCSKCKEWKDESEFGKHKGKPDGLMYQCKLCDNARARKWYSKNRRRKLTYDASYKNDRYHTDAIYRLKVLSRRALSSALKRGGFSKRSPTAKSRGCSDAELKQHLFARAEQEISKFTEQKFLSGHYHLDHCIPLATAKTEADIFKLSHYSNLRLLPAADNLKKGDTVSLDCILMWENKY